MPGYSRLSSRPPPRIVSDAPSRRPGECGGRDRPPRSGGSSDACSAGSAVLGDALKNWESPIDVVARSLAPTDYEVSLVLEGGAGQGADTMFKFELNYAGVFRVENFPQEQVQPVVMIEGPRLLFPFARQIIADAVRGGSYPPLYIDPIDFHSLYLQRLAAAGGQQQQRTA